MINTKIYFGNNQLKTTKVKIKIIANYTENLKIDIGYKPPTDPLMEEFTPIKKITIWERKNLFETESNYITFLDDYEEISSIKRKSGFISEEWDLFSIGFISDDYVKADERIWYLKITCLEKIKQDDIILLDTFELEFNQLKFSTLLHPLFDGSTPVVIPIRGVNHELKPSISVNLKQKDSKYESKGSTGNTPGNNLDCWCAVFATSSYYGDTSPYMDDEAAVFIEGASDQNTPNRMYDYGWSIAYCMDGSTTFKTVDKTKPIHFNYLLNFVDGKTNANDKCIVFVDCHGVVHNGETFILVGNSMYDYGHDEYYNVIDVEECSNWINDICKDKSWDNTYVFFWINTCYSKNIAYSTEWNDKHNNHLQIWGYYPQSYIEASGTFGSNLHWYYENGIQGGFYRFFRYLENNMSPIDWIYDGVKAGYEAMCDEEGHEDFTMHKKDWFPIAYVFHLIVG